MGKKKMSKEERRKFEAEKAEAFRVEMEKERFVQINQFYSNEIFCISNDHP